jgi:putative Holliday junction resolvase
VPSPAASETKIRRILALDVGSRRIGLAVTDALGITAQGLDTLDRSNKRADFRLLGGIIKKYDIGEIVVGNPLRMSGTSSSQSEKVAVFAEELRQRFHLPSISGTSA